MYNDTLVMSGVPKNDSFSDWTDEDLLLEYRLTDRRELFEELVRRFEREMYVFLRRYIGNAEDAEEAFQALFLQVHLKCDLFEEGRKLRPWLYRIATNFAIDLKRKQKRRPTISIDAEEDSDDSPTPAFSNLLVGNEPEPSENALEAERAEKLRDALEELPEPFRQTLDLVYFQGLSYRDTAEVLDIPFGTVKSRLQSAIRKLNEILKRENGENL